MEDLDDLPDRILIFKGKKIYRKLLEIKEKFSEIVKEMEKRELNLNKILTHSTKITNKEYRDLNTKFLK